MKGGGSSLFQSTLLTRHLPLENKKIRGKPQSCYPLTSDKETKEGTSYLSVASLLLLYQLIGVCVLACAHVRNINYNFLYTCNNKGSNLNLKMLFCEALTLFTCVMSSIFMCFYEVRKNSLC
jgi:hypothetical protein